MLKITGRMTFGMTSKLKDRMTNIAKYMNSAEHTGAMIWDLSAVPDLDYTCILAIRVRLALVLHISLSGSMIAT